MRLPAEYRDYLRQVAAGGAGLGYGLFVLSRNAIGKWGWTGDGAELTERGSLRVEFSPADPTPALTRLDATEPPQSDASAYVRWLDQVRPKARPLSCGVVSVF